MKTSVPDLEPVVRYHLDDGTVTNADPPEDRVTLVELHYPCPRCDHPNIAAHTPPLVEGLLDVCDHCERRYRLTPRPDTDKTPETLSTTALHDAADQLDEKRRARILGERLPTSAVKTARRGRRAGEYALLGGVLGLFPVTVGLAIVASDIAPWAVLLFGLLGMAAWGTGALGLNRLIKTVTRSRLANYVDEDSARVACEHPRMLEHGQSISDGNAELYVPPRENSNGDRVEREIV